MRLWIWASLMAMALIATAPSASTQQPAQFDEAAERQAIQTVVANMEAAWNRGDYHGYMLGFSNPDVIFVSGGRIKDGWQGTLDEYIANYGPTPQTRGHLEFSDITIEFLSPDAAQLVGRYSLMRPDSPMEGINTRLFRKRNGQWVITLNHVSARPIERP